MIFSFWNSKESSDSLVKSKLFDENTFYEAFIKDLNRCKEEVIIESPYITCKRMDLLESIFQKLMKHGVKVYIITRDPREHEEKLARQAELEISIFEEMGVQVLLCAGNHHRKLAILDRKILWEGSLNILSQMYSREIMRRIESEALTKQMFNFLNLGKLTKENSFIKRMFL
ncbi:MAG: phospholipase D-like domain-containing protein [Microgenomates group bacterium]|jgi:phosphatidylserine/phosphatidylglycerophosphate/cardiolipin synthase-like enzyme